MTHFLGHGVGIAHSIRFVAFAMALVSERLHSLRCRIFDVRICSAALVSAAAVAFGFFSADAPSVSSERAPPPGISIRSIDAVGLELFGIASLANVELLAQPMKGHARIVTGLAEWARPTARGAWFGQWRRPADIRVAQSTGCCSSVIRGGGIGVVIRTGRVSTAWGLESPIALAVFGASPAAAAGFRFLWGLCVVLEFDRRSDRWLRRSWRSRFRILTHAATATMA
ncbi:hypothetical protein [Sphingomonas glacialis]|uniref:hypothetical protein n=1 Tax=Sphingomonas glacialis TaxID=658225 RepID=UPI001674B1FF|nr:hypothetical protein [Sphingomonas glacialis]